MRNQLSGFSDKEKNIELIKSRDSIHISHISSSVQDINEMIENLNNNYSNHMMANQYNQSK